MEQQFSCWQVSLRASCGTWSWDSGCAALFAPSKSSPNWWPREQTGNFGIFKERMLQKVQKPWTGLAVSRGNFSSKTSKRFLVFNILNFENITKLFIFRSLTAIFWSQRKSSGVINSFINARVIIMNCRNGCCIRNSSCKTAAAFWLFRTQETHVKVKK